jgi:hypothetical protein
MMPIRSWLAWSWTLVILGVCWFPGRFLPLKEEAPRPFFIPQLDKMIHCGIFLLFAALWMRVGEPAGRAVRVLLLGLALAVVSELGQEMPLVRRDASWMDGGADLLGIALGVYASGFLHRTRRERAA